MTAEKPTPVEAPSRDAVRRYGPLGVLVILALAVFLPSALNLPQANPQVVAEYAPVPPKNNDTPPALGNFSGLGLGGSSTLTGGTDFITGETPIIPRGGRSQFKCVIVNGVARQTDDPLSPPCVPAFSGDNGGATYKGVSGKDIDVVYYIECSQTNNQYAPTSKGQESETCGSQADADAPPSNNDFLYTRVIKRYAAYFNSRYQTYGRHVHIHIAYGNFAVTVTGQGGCQADCRRQDAASAIKSYAPFAFVEGGGSSDDFAQAVAKDGRLDFGGQTHHESFYQQYPGLIWSYVPSLEEQAHIYTSYMCQQAVNRTASLSGNPGDTAKPRKFGVIYFDDGTSASYTDVKNLAVADLRRCGVTGTIPEFSYSDLGSVGGDPSMVPDKQTKLRQMQNAGVTSLLWLGGANGDWSRAANDNKWYPEWFVYGDGLMEDFVTGRYSNQNAWAHSVVVSQATLVESQEAQPCALALYDVDPSWPTQDISWACPFYNDMRQLFTGIQVAGPKLTPQSMDEGFHAIPAVESTSPQVPACFYRTGDYTCVKDAIAMWWDRSAQIRGWTGSGCYRVPLAGKRFLADGWPNEDVKAMFDPTKDACNGYTTNASANPYAYQG